jgi:phosphoribosylformylglycinamidine synthase
MIFTIETMLQKGFRDRHGEHVRQDILDSGVKAAPKVRYSQLYRIEGELTPQERETIAARLLTDPVTDTYRIHEGTGADARGACHAIEVWPKHGVTDTVAESVVKAVRDLGIGAAITVKTGHRYVFEGARSVAAVRQIAERLLVNHMVQEYTIR